MADHVRTRLVAMLGTMFGTTFVHDHLQQLLAGARLNMEMVSEEAGLADHDSFQNATNLVKLALESSRTLMAELSPPVLYMQGLCEALKWLARWMEKVHKLRVDLEADPMAEPTQQELKLLLFQSVRELLFNTAKHAGTDHANVDMRLADGRIVITVSDRGSGFDPKTYIKCCSARSSHPSAPNTAVRKWNPRKTRCVLPEKRERGKQCSRLRRDVSTASAAGPTPSRAPGSAKKAELMPQVNSTTNSQPHKGEYQHRRFEPLLQSLE